MTAPPAPPAHGPGEVVRSLVPARIDRLPWSPFHTRMVVALGVAWILDGLEITVAGAVAAVLTRSDTLRLTAGDAGLIATVYLVGQVAGALWFGRLADRLGRRRLFLLTFGVYLFGSGLTALTLGQGTAWNAFLYFTRFLAGTGIGGEYSAINSAIQEMVPARYRGRVDLLVNGTYWAGAILGTAAELWLLHTFPDRIAWRLGFLLGPLLGLTVFLIRRQLPESPRWLAMHGRPAEAEEAIARIEREVERAGHRLAPVDADRAILLRQTPRAGYPTLLRLLFRRYPGRSVLGSSLLITQSFLYNAIFFTYTLVLTRFYGVDADRAPLYLMGFAAGNLLGPVLLGPLFDTVGRRRMIAGTYLFSGVALALTAALFQADVLSATTQTTAWCVIFFFASAGASAGYLTVGEIFPLEVRGQAIAVFFALAQCVGATGPYLYGHLIGDGHDRTRLFLGYLLGAAVMMLGGLTEVFLGVDAEGTALEDVAAPLSAVASAPALPAASVPPPLESVPQEPEGAGPRAAAQQARKRRESGEGEEPGAPV
ncbi:MFS transporter [Streptomyces gamaensis]|uniref:MFS transporter n=1 Tax=Streptomyces gamaensis TaxID=1763542 RepID=A0ABW0Z5Z0_9ACTN